jgi:hypothetical protein
MDEHQPDDPGIQLPRWIPRGVYFIILMVLLVLAGLGLFYAVPHLFAGYFLEQSNIPSLAALFYLP